MASVRRELDLTFVIAMAWHRRQREPFVGMTRAQERALGLRDVRDEGLRTGGRLRHRSRTRHQWVYDIYRHQAPQAAEETGRHGGG